MTDLYLEHGDQNHPLRATGSTRVGRGEACELRLDGEGVEEEHAVLRLEGKRVLLQSLVPGERDVRINGVAVHAAPLQPGDSIRFGDVEATFELEDAASRLRLADGVRDLVRGVNAIGRDPASGVVLDDESVSRRHAVIFVLPSGQTVLRDLGSANGTVFKGRRLGEIELADGDEIRVGDELLHLRREQGTADSTATPSGLGEGIAATVVGRRPPAATAAAAEPPAPRLELELAGEKHQLHDGTFNIGRAPECDLVIDDDALVSRHHAELTVSVTEVTLRDLGSSNGTRVNGEAITGSRPLRDGDRLGIGGQELLFSAELPVTPFAQTVVAGKLPASSPGTSASAPGGGRPGAGSVGIVPSDRESALLALDLASDAGEGEIRKRYQELYSEFQIRLTNAPTPELKTAYERRLHELRAAVDILSPQMAASIDLPSLEPVEDAGGAGGESDVAAAGGDGTPEAGTAAQRQGQRKGIPRSTVIMAVVDLAVVAAAIFCLFGLLRAQAGLRTLEAERDAKQVQLRELEAAIPATIAATESLMQAKGELLESVELKICNHSSGALRWQWLHTAWYDPGINAFRDFDTARDTSWEFLFDDRIEPGATFASEYVVGEQRVWPGDAIFFSALFIYSNRDVLVVGATPDLDGGCYPLNLDG